MRLEVAYQRFADGRNRTHFLLDAATLRATASQADGSTVAVAAARVGRAELAFTLDLTPALVPKQMTRLELAYEVPVTLDGRTFRALRIGQVLSPQPIGPDGVASATYRLTPAGWRDSLQRLRVSNMATHPLVNASGLAANRVVLNPLVLDITEGWLHLHRENVQYKHFRQLSAKSPTAFTVLAHLGGNPFVWYGVVPTHLRGATSVSPHVFFSPADNQESQNIGDEKVFLHSNKAHFDGPSGWRLFDYLQPPVPDARVPDEKQTFAEADRARNVVGFRRVIDPKTQRPTRGFTTKHWSIGAGFQKAFEHAGSGTPVQLLLMPQRVNGGSNGWAVTGQLRQITDTVVDLLQTNTLLLSGASDAVVAKDKLVLSCYSESGVDLWIASRANADRIKAVIAIEPQNMNSLQNDYRPRDQQTGDLIEPVPPSAPLGKDVIPLLLERKVQVFVIGRHHGHYGPQITGVKRVRLLPKDPAAIFAYPPNPVSNEFVKYRVHRITDPASDPLMLDEEKEIIAELAARGITGVAALKALFPAAGNEDRSLPRPGDGVNRWYSHQFALSGGDELKLDPAHIYGTPVSYRTFFQVAVAEVG